ncbi:CD48 antigen-like isoform X1 [Genypterus blacodes]|uniref:CD48 antigen-like isoform X1 n=1 Tax=Genypterus blacodes TaxID=154954 RepID=UPI003F762363
MDKMRSLIFFMVMISSATLEIKDNLTATEGGSITLPDPVVELGFLSYGRTNIAYLKNREIDILEENFRNRLLWNSSTGLLTLTDLQKNDSGIYDIDSKRGNVFLFSYKLSVYVMSSSATLEIKDNLTATEGGSITLPDPVMELGFLLYGRKNIAYFRIRKIDIFEENFRNRLLWNNSTGLLTLTDLQKNDSGIYHIDSKKGNVFLFSYKLSVYECVQQPTVKASAVSADSCTLVCLVEKGDETTLLWYRGEERVNQISSDLSLSLTLHKQDFNSTFKCVAANPAEEKFISVNATVSCGQDNTEEKGFDHGHVGLILISALIILTIASLITWMFVMKKCRGRTQRKTHNRMNFTEVDYV